MTPQKIETLREQLADELMCLYLDEMDALIAEAGYEMEVPEDATMGDYIAEVDALINDPSQEIEEGLRSGMKMVFGRLVKVGKAAAGAVTKKVAAVRQVRHMKKLGKSLDRQIKALPAAAQ